MKKQHLGKLLTILCFPYLLWAGSVKAILAQPLIYKGDSATLTLEAQGDDIKFPNTDEIAGYPILGTSQSQSITSINGNRSKKLSKSYTFIPIKSIQIPSFDIEVDGEKLSTTPLKLEVSTPKAADKNAPVQLEMKLAKNDLYVGEPVRLDIIFKRAPKQEFAKVEIAQPNLQSFWAKKLPDTAPKVDNGNITQTYSYLLFPQQVGDFTIPATFAKLGTREKRSRRSMYSDPFFDGSFFSAYGGSQIRWKKLFSDEVTLHVKALPDDLEILGDFHIEATVDKKEVLANKPLNLTIQVQGEGNLDDIKKFALDIPDAVVYADEPKVQASVDSGSYKGVFRQKVAIVADRNYTIPAISFTYFDKKSQKAKTIQTTAIPIAVKGGISQADQHIEQRPIIKEKSDAKVAKSTIESATNKPQTKTKEQSYEKYLYLLLGVLLGAIISYLAFGFKPKKRIKKEQDIIKKIEKSKDDKTLFELLLPFAHKDIRIKKALDKLEKNLYQNAKEKIDKEEILDYFDELQEAF